MTAPIVFVLRGGVLNCVLATGGTGFTKPVISIYYFLCEIRGLLFTGFSIICFQYIWR